MKPNHTRASVIVALSALVLFPWNVGAADERSDRPPRAGEATEGDRGRTSQDPVPDADRERLAEIVRDLIDGQELGCGQTLRLLLGLEKDADIDDEKFARLLLGLGENDEIDSEEIPRLLGLEAGEKLDCERMLRMLLGLDESEEIDNERLVRLLLGLGDEDKIDRKQIAKLLEAQAAGD